MGMSLVMDYTTKAMDPSFRALLANEDFPSIRHIVYFIDVKKCKTDRQNDLQRMSIFMLKKIQKNKSTVSGFDSFIKFEMFVCQMTMLLQSR